MSIKNPTVIPVEEYVNSDTKIMHKCLTHNVYWKTTPTIVLKGHGCDICRKERFRKKKLKSHEQYVEEVKNINPNITVVEKYINAKTAIKHYCRKHNIYWEALPDNILKGNGCVECGKEKSSEKNKKTHEQYVKELNTINKNVIVIEKYVDAITPILHKCLVDNHEWYAQPANILSGTGCPKCNESKGERKISLWLNNKCIVYESQKSFPDCRDIKPLPFDFYLPIQNSIIEYDGKQHYMPIDYFGGEEAFKRRVQHDKIKNEYCRSNGISLLRIPYFKNIEEELNNFLFI